MRSNKSAHWRITNWNWNWKLVEASKGGVRSQATVGRIGVTQCSSHPWGREALRDSSPSACKVEWGPEEGITSIVEKIKNIKL